MTPTTTRRALQASAGTTRSRLLDCDNYAFRGLHEEAVDLLAKKSAALAGYAGAELHLWRLRHELGISPFLKPLRTDPRWAAILAESR
jgi:hypothetical protein